MSLQPPPGMVESLSQPIAGQPEAPQSPPPGMIESIGPELDEQKYGDVGSQALAGLEGTARGATLGLSDIAEQKLFGTKPEDIKGRMRANPATSFAGSVLGGAGLIAATGGAGAAAEALTGGAGLGASVLAGGAEGAVFGAGSAVSDYALGDPEQNAGKVLANIGFGAILGAGAGVLGHGIKSALGKFGNVKDSIAEKVATEAESANRSASTANALDAVERQGLKSNAPEIMKSAEELNLPVMNGMVSGDPWIQKAEDSLLNGAPTYSAIKRANMYAEGYNGAVKVLGDVVPETPLTKAQTGAIVQRNLSNKIAQEYEPIKDLYSSIREVTPTIELSERSAPAIARNILELPEVTQTPNSPQARLAKAVAENILNAKTVEDISFQKSAVKGMANSTIPAEKRMAAILSDKLNDWEESSIIRYGKKLASGLENDPEKAANFAPNIERINQLLPQIEQAKATYKPFIEDVKKLSEQLGKGRVHGPQDALDFLNNLDVEDVASRLTQKNNSEFRTWFASKFPEEMAVLREYQKGALRDAASKTGQFSPKVLFNKINSLEPEIQESIFHPDELRKLKAAETYLRAFPKSFNPSGTSGMSAFRDFFKSPTGAIIGNTRDFAIDQYIKHMGSLPEGIRPNPYEVGSEMAKRFNHMNAVKNFADQANKKISDNISNILSSTAGHSAAGK